MLTLMFPKRQFRLTVWLVVLLLLWGSTTRAHALENPSTPNILNWRDLKSPNYIWPADGAIYSTFQTANGTKVHVMVFDTKAGNWIAKPVYNDATLPTADAADQAKASAAINGGYFNLSDGVSASYIVIDGKQVADPRQDEALMKNPKLQPFIETILNRSELRFLEDKHGKRTIQIAPHNAIVPADLKLVDSLQAGPQLLPKLTAKEEAFIRQDPDGTPVDAIGAERGAARTAFGITADGYGMFICAADSRQDQESHGLTLRELSDIMASLGCVSAINLDGGASTTMYVRLNSDAGASATPAVGKVVCGRVPETKVRSVLILQHVF